ncbi:MAG: hypothetical protein ABFS86_01250 [Planctomycetota bacterium]
MWIGGRVVRIPLPQMKAGLKDRWKKRTRYRRRDGTGVVLRGSQAGTRRLRRGLHEEAALYRSGLRWICLAGMWAALGVAAFLGPHDRFSPWPFGVFVCFILSFVAAFARTPPVRMIASLLITSAAGLTAGFGFHPEVCLGVALFGLGLVVLNGLRL